MFYRKKRFWETKWFYGLLLGIFALGYGANFLLLSDSSNDDAKEETLLQAETEDDAHTEASERLEVDDFAVDDEERDGLEMNETDETEAGYRLQEQDGIVKLYYCSGAETDRFVRDTEIQYFLLGDEDQALLKKGTELMTKEELSEFLQDFES